MPRGKPISSSQRQSIIQHHNNDLNVSTISKNLGLPWSSVKLIIQKWKINGHFEDKPRKGRPRKTTARMDRKIVSTALQNRSMTVHDLNEDVFGRMDLTVSDETLRRRLHEAKLYGKQARKKPLLTKKHMAARRKWCKERRNWTKRDWEKVLWSDESKFCLFGRKGYSPVWRRPGEALKAECLHPTVKHGGGGVMVWGCFSRNGVGNLVNIPGIMDQVVQAENLN